MNMKDCSFCGGRALAMAWLVMLLPGIPPALAFIGEPETLLYGRIVNHANPNVEELITAGQLRWSIRKPDGSLIQLSGEVDVLGAGRYSYLVRVPHQAVMLGQETPAALTVPLGTSKALAVHTTITVDGLAAEILPPATSAFDLDQWLRGAAVRIDLEVNRAAADTDGDGMPDWWEDHYALDKQNAADALADLNGNGRNNLAEFLAGYDPQADARLPQWLTREVIAYAGGKAVVLLEAADADSGAAQLTMTLDAVPAGGRLWLRNTTALPSPVDRELAAGASFTQADVLAGRLVFAADSSAAPGPLRVSVRDENPAHAAATAEIPIRLFDPPQDMTAATAAEALRVTAAARAAQQACIVADLGGCAGSHRIATPSSGLNATAYQQYQASFGADPQHVLLGGPAGDIITGGGADDIIHGDAGDDTLSGGAGADTFVFAALDDGADAIVDFNRGEGDVLDLTGLLRGASTRLSDYVRIGRSGTDAVVEISAAGTGQGFTDFTIRLKNSSLQAADVENLYYSGQLQAGLIGLPPRLSVAATLPLASENGPVDGMFTVTREGSSAEAMAVGFSISGNATNGADYQNIAASLWIPAGETTAVVLVRPYVDTVVEFNEVVRLELLPAATYLLGQAAADVVIEDLKPQIGVEVLEEIASVADASPGVILMRRGGLLSPEVFVQFTLAGTAVNGTDYNYVSPYVTLASGQTARTIEIMPKAGVKFGNAEAKVVRMTVKPDAAYALPAATAAVTLVPGKISYDAWLASNNLAGVGEPDRLLRYGFSVDAQRPTAPESLQRLPKTSIENGHLVLRFRRKPAAVDLKYEVEYSNDLRQWLAGGDVVEDISLLVAPNDPGVAVFRAKRTMSSEAAGFMRVRLVLPDPY